MKRPARNRNRTLGASLKVILAFGSLLTGVGCSAPLQSWRLPAYRPDFSGLDLLCAYRGKRVAIVPGGEFDGLVTSNRHRFSSKKRNYATVTANGTLTVTVDNGSPHVVAGGSGLPPEVLSLTVQMLQEYGFVVVDRQHVAEVLEEQDMQAVYAADVGRIGELLGADILIVLSVLQTPVAYFAAGGSGDWALGFDVRSRSYEAWISVADGTYLATFSDQASGLALCGSTHIEARQELGIFATETVFRVRASDGSYTLLSDVDMSGCVADAVDDLKSLALREWESACGQQRGRAR